MARSNDDSKLRNRKVGGEEHSSTNDNDEKKEKAKPTKTYRKKKRLPSIAHMLKYGVPEGEGEDTLSTKSLFILFVVFLISLFMFHITFRNRPKPRAPYVLPQMAPRDTREKP
mmetsp:Transcript_53373/g.79320  ORF Transcript_53373/g.79320 Transcript_53373/m.79320 type:complete len:113 (+) Transcript_53373:183-521(+)